MTPLIGAVPVTPPPPKPIHIAVVTDTDGAWRGSCSACQWVGGKRGAYPVAALEAQLHVSAVWHGETDPALTP